MERTLTDEQRDAIQNDGNTLLLANPGTGKTFTIAQKFLHLVKAGTKPENILCITFTNRARDRMEDEIVRNLRAAGVDFVHSDLNVHTFHSFAMKSLGDTELIDANFLRLIIFRYLKDNAALNYEDEYLISEIVPGLENHIRKLKSFGILPSDIDLGSVKKNLPENVNMERTDLESFVETFADIYRAYEREKGRRRDYTDLLISFLKLEEKPKFDYVLVDELQDMNNLEARIAIECSGKFFVVGDRKQSIFSFQGGSISNFGKFQESRKFILSRNHRSTNEILNYASEYLRNAANDTKYSEELKELRNENAPPGEPVRIVHLESDDPVEGIGGILQIPEVSGSNRIAIISRKNESVRKICRQLDKLNIKYSTSLSSHSENARSEIIDFISGLITNDGDSISRCLVSPFFPGDLREISALLEKKRNGFTFSDLEQAFPGFASLRKKCAKLQSLPSIMEEFIIPASVAFGHDYFRTAVSVNSALIEALSTLKEITPSLIIEYLRISSFEDTEVEQARITVSSVHRAKGLEFETVIYLPSPDRKKHTLKFYEAVAEGILKSLGYDFMEEIEDEAARIDFVAFTRAEKYLYVVPRLKDSDIYSNRFSQPMNCPDSESGITRSFEEYSRAYTLFLSGAVEEARKLLNRKSRWLLNAINTHFNSLSKLSYSALMSDRPFDYLKTYILKIRASSKALTMGSNVHAIAQKIANEELIEVKPEDKPYAVNISAVIRTLQREFPNVSAAEKWMEVSLDKLLGMEPDITFRGAADLILSNGSKYLILDWKTSKNEGYSSDHMVQLEAYRRLYSCTTGIPENNIEAAIGYIALRNPVNRGKPPSFKITFQKTPDKQLEKLKSKIGSILSWKGQPSSFIDALKENPDESHLYEELLAEIYREVELPEQRANPDQKEIG